MHGVAGHFLGGFFFNVAHLMQQVIAEVHQDVVIFFPLGLDFHAIHRAVSGAGFLGRGFEAKNGGSIGERGFVALSFCGLFARGFSSRFLGG